MSVETTYQKKTQLEHILLRPDTYVGSTEYQDQQIWVLGNTGENFENRNIKYVPALYKIFDEILVNAADNYSRDKRMKRLDVVIDPQNNMISVLNDGKGIPVQIHKEYNIYVPELIFGHLLTSSNYNDAEKKVTGGRNGYGAKLTNIFSSKFIVETADAKNKKKFTMTWTKNMSEQSDPQITSYSESDFTKITFYPDLKKFHMKELEKDIVDLMKKRVYDMAGVIGGSVKVSLNGNKINVSNFSDYTDFYLKQQGGEIIKIMDSKGTNNERWEVIASLSEGQFQQVSFVNSICTSKGGTHVNYITDQLTDKLMDILKKKEKNLAIKPFQVKSHMWIFLNCLIENPAFDSQTKETLTLRQSDFGSTCEISEKFTKDLIKSNIINHILLQARAKEQAKMAKTLQGKKQSRLLGVPKLEDANDAGTRNGESCTLILTEGDSAKALAMSGIEVVGRDKYGVFPLKGKMLNVRDSTTKSITENVEIQNIIKIMGMKLNVNYENAKSLRYGSIMIMADQDHDGSHIKGLFINFIQSFWPSLYKMPGFLKEFITPIVKVKKGSQHHSFYSIQDFKKWKNSCPNVNAWTTKYYKGLGTSTDQEAQEYFNNMNKHTINFQYDGKECDDSIDLAFNKKRAEDRKQWLVTYNPEENVDHSQKQLTYKDFVYKELINFSISDNARSIPSICDGLKPGQRKILYACFKRNLKNEIKVAQLSGYVAEHSAYHHGEASLAQTIIGMAQNFVGTNNINYLLPIGQFGSRNMGGKEAASARYIHTALNRITRLLFPEPDDHILTYLEDDGQTVEPIYYLPIIPTSLLNGADGIGTGWSTSIPCYNPRELVDSIEKRMMGVPFQELLPWYKGFTGEISNNEKSQITIKGRYRVINETTIEITELPANKWIRDFKNFLEEKLESSKDKEPELEDIKEYHAGNRVHFVIKMSEKQMEAVMKEGVEKYFKLQSTIPTTNMVLFTNEGKLKRFANTCEIMEEFYEIRLNAYQLRKDFLISRLVRELEILSNKKRFILGVINETLRVRNAKRKDLVKELVVQKFTQMKDMPKVKSTKGVVEKEEDSEDQVAAETVSHGDVNPREFNYLLNLPIWNLTFEKVEEIKQQQQLKQEEVDRLQSTDTIDLWKEDLKNFEKCLDEIEDEEEKEMMDRINKGNSKGGKKGMAVAVSSRTKKPAQNKKKKQDSDDDDENDDKNEMDIEDDNSDFEIGNKKNNKKSQKAQSQQTGNSKGGNKVDAIRPVMSQDTGISSKTNKNNQSITGFLSQPSAVAGKNKTPVSTAAPAAPVEIKKVVDPLQELMDRYSFNNSNDVSKQSSKVEESSNAVLSQNYSMSLEDRIKMRLNNNSQDNSQLQQQQLSQISAVSPLFSQNKKEPVQKISDEESEEEFKFVKSNGTTNKLTSAKKEKDSDLLDELDGLFGNETVSQKRDGQDLKKIEPKVVKKRVVQKETKVAATAVAAKKKKAKESSEDEGSSEGSEGIDNGDEDDDFMVSDEDSGDKKKKGKKNVKGQKENAKNSGNLKQTKAAPKGKVENNKKSKEVISTPMKKSAEKPVLTISEDEDVAELKNNQVFSSRTRGKKSNIPKSAYVDDSDEDDLNDDEFSQDNSEQEKKKKTKKQPAKAKKAVKNDESSDENYF